MGPCFQLELSCWSAKEGLVLVSSKSWNLNAQ